MCNLSTSVQRLFIRLVLVVVLSKMVCHLALIVECHQALLVDLVVGAMAFGLIVVACKRVVALAVVLLASESDCHIVSAVSAPLPTYSFFQLFCCHSKMHLVRVVRNFKLLMFLFIRGSITLISILPYIVFVNVVAFFSNMFISATKRYFHSVQSIFRAVSHFIPFFYQYSI